MAEVESSGEVDLGVSDSTDVDAKVVKQYRDEIIKGDKKRAWKDPTRVELGTRSWVPHAAGEKNSLLHVAALDSLPRYLATRISAAFDAGHHICVGLTTSALFTPEWVELLVSVDADVYVLDDFDKKARFKRRHVLAAMADLQVPVEAEVRAKIGTIALAMLDRGSAQDKGRRLEAILAFLFSQVTDFRVVRRNHRNKTQEIDIILQIHQASHRVWQQPGRPLILVESKNQKKKKADQPMFTIFMGKIRTKRQSARVGFLVSASGFTEDLRIESLRYSESEHCVVLVGPERLEELFAALDLDGVLEQMVIDAFVE